MKHAICRWAWATSCAVAVLLAAAGCRQTLDEGSGDPVLLELVSGSGLATKTAFGTPSGGTVAINWTTDDVVRIGGPLAATEGNASQHWQDYAISGGANTTSARVAPYNSGSPLCWSASSQAWPRTLFGVYPSPALIAGDIPQEYASMCTLADDGSFVGFIPSGISYTMKEGTGPSASRTEWEPDMRYAYMAAKDYAASADEPVTLNFRPAFTAFEVTILTTQSFGDFRLRRLALRNGSDMSGLFSGEWVQDASGDALAVRPAGPAMERYAEASFADVVVEAGNTLVSSGHPLTLTFLTLGCDHSNVSLDIFPEGRGQQSLNFGGYVFKAGKRYRIAVRLPDTYGVILGEDIDWNSLLNSGEDFDWNDLLNSGENLTWRK